ncbi:MAG: LysR family transcriptional regulator [Phyllobacterium sp.]
MLTTRQLSIFRAVMESATLTDAANALNISQPGVSKSMQELENTVGFPLFRRRAGRLTPTKAARSFYSEVLIVLRAMAAAEKAAENLREARVGYVRIAATSSLMNGLIPNAVEQFRRLRPEAQVILYSRLNHEVVRMVSDLQVDFGLVLAPTNDAGTIAETICSAELITILPTGHPLSERRFVTAHDLQAYPLIAHSRDLPIGWDLDQIYSNAGLLRSIAIEVSQSAAACSLVSAGAGIAVVDGFSLMNDAYPQLEVRPIQPTVEIKARLLMPEAQDTSRLAKVFLRCLRQTIVDASCKADPRSRINVLR